MLNGLAAPPTVDERPSPTLVNVAREQHRVAAQRAVCVYVARRDLPQLDADALVDLFHGLLHVIDAMPWKWEADLIEIAEQAFDRYAAEMGIDNG